MNKKLYCRVSHADARGLIAQQVKVASGFFSRLRGLLGRKKLEKGEGLILYPCSSIHCFGMQFPIDVVFLDEQKRVVGIRENMKPGSHASNHSAHLVLELNAGEVQKHGVKNGEELVFSSYAKECQTVKKAQ